MPLISNQILLKIQNQAKWTQTVYPEWIEKKKKKGNEIKKKQTHKRVNLLRQ